MTRRPGIVVATFFAFGALLGLATSAVFLDVDASEIRSSAETRASAVPGPIADLLMANLDQQEVFGRVADDVRADQIRNILVAAVVAGVLAVGLGMAFARRAPDQPTEHRSTTRRRGTLSADRGTPECPACAGRGHPWWRWNRSNNRSPSS